tara:strand:+ start:310 stop:552 length:243 start_codon:yes stop_codon:yes gene_type:complete
MWAMLDEFSPLASYFADGGGFGESSGKKILNPDLFPEQIRFLAGESSTDYSPVLDGSQDAALDSGKEFDIVAANPEGQRS